MWVSQIAQMPCVGDGLMISSRAAIPVHLIRMRLGTFRKSVLNLNLILLFIGAYIGGRVLQDDFDFGFAKNASLRIVVWMKDDWSKNDCKFNLCNGGLAFKEYQCSKVAYKQKNTDGD